MCARLEGVAKKLEARSAGVSEAQLRALLLEHQSSLEAQQLAQAKKLRDEMRSLADVQRQQALSMSSIVSSLANLEARGGGGGGSGGGGISLGMADAHQLHEKMESGKAAWPKHRLGSTAPRHPCFLRLALLALGCAPHSGGTALPLSAQWEAAARVAALPNSPILGVELPAGKEVAQLLAENHALEAMVERVRKEQVKATYIMQA